VVGAGGGGSCADAGYGSGLEALLKWLLHMTYKFGFSYFPFGLFLLRCCYFPALCLSPPLTETVIERWPVLAALRKTNIHDVPLA
jgi:hypothetical protein